ncbi:MAG: hypothetical protein WBP45_14265 [Daejeonella sp.]
MKDLIFEKLYEFSKVPYQKFFKKNQPWNISKQELLLFPEGTLGFHLGCFLSAHDFELEDKLEDHDVFHVLTNTGVTVHEEIGMQCYFLGNGKRSIYLFTVLSLGVLFYPSKISYFIKQYKRGKKADPFHGLDYLTKLLIPLKTLRERFSIE